MIDNARQTGAAIEAHYRFVAWMLVAVEKFPRNHKFTVGDRITAICRDVLEALIDATYTRERNQHLRRANLGIEKLRFLLRLEFDDETWSQELADEAFSDLLRKHGGPTDLKTALRQSVGTIDQQSGPPSERRSGRTKSRARKA